MRCTVLTALLIATEAEAAQKQPRHGAADTGVATTTASTTTATQSGSSSSSRWDQHSFLFMGGLQRSGTTWLEGLVSSPRVSGLSFDNVDLAAYHERQPWLLQNHTQEYFEMVVRSGGVEGKFVQGAYPYVYTVRDVGRQGRTLDSLLLDERAASARSAERLYAEWSLFWDTSKPVLLEKTPENLLMGPYLQTAFGSSATHFAFVMRHPLVWALAIEKWIFPDFKALRTVEDRIAFWFETMTRAVEHLPHLRDALLLQLETASASSELQLGVAGHLLCTMTERTSGGDLNHSSSSDVRSLLAPDLGGESKEILASSMAYVSCWLSGMEFKSSLRRCVPRKPFRDPAFRQQPELLAVDNRYRLRQIAKQREAQANLFGYTFRPFLALARKQTSAVLHERVVPGTPASMASQIGVTQGVNAVHSALRPFLPVVPSQSELAAASPAPVAAPVKAQPSVILVYHKMGFDRDRPSGMDLRMTQIVNSLVSLQHTVHFLCHCDVHPSQLSPFADPNVVIYTGSLQEQFSQAVATASSLRSVLIFFTTLTMAVHNRMLQGEEQWYAEPTGPLPEEQVLSWVRARPTLHACTVAVADDIHYLRAKEIMARHDEAKAQLASEWIRRRELEFHSAVDGTATVSLEDAETLNKALAGHSTPVARKPNCMVGCACSMTWVPYVQVTRSEGSIEPFGRRQEGMLYVGGMHGLAVIAMEWLLQKVQPLIRRSSARGELELMRGGKGHLHLAGPGWAQHAAESRILNESVTAGYVTILGVLSDMQLDQRLQDHKVFVAPVLNGTGIATKNVLAMAHGIPLVTTLVGLNGLGLPLDQRAILVSDEPSGFASHVLNVQSSERTFDVTWRAALEHTRTYLSAERQRTQLCTMMGCTTPPARPQPAASSSSSGSGSGGRLCRSDASPRWPLLRASDVANPSVPPNGLPVVPIRVAATNVSKRQRQPLLVIGAHGVEGGANLVGKAIAEACREYFTPHLGWKCIVRDDFDSCDPEADVCVHKQSHFSAGRFADRGYRFLHVVRSPLDTLTRSFQLSVPNATQTMNASALLVALEAHWKMLSNEKLHVMQDMAEGHAADPHSMNMKLEDLLPVVPDTGHSNETLAKMFGFWLDAEPSDARVVSVAAAAAKVLPAAGRAELQGDTQRKHMSKLLTRKPAKCSHVSRVQQAVGYAALPCTTSKASSGDGHSDGDDADGEPQRQRSVRRRRRMRRLMEIDAPRPRRWRLAAAWV